MKIRVLQVVSCFQYGGTEAYIINNFKSINKEEFSFDFWIAQTNNSKYISKKYVEEIEGLGANFYYGKPLQSKLKFMKALYKHIKKNGPYDVIHVHMNLANAWVVLVAFLAGIKIRISHSHATSGKEAKSLPKILYTKILEYIIKLFSTKKLACSNEAGIYLYGKDYFLKNGEICNNGINVDKFFNVDKSKVNILRDKFNIPKDSFIVGNITRFDSIKNQDFVVKVFNEILKINCKSILILGGVDAGELSNIKQKVRELGIESNVRFIGIRNDINIWLHLINAYLFPSLFEGFGIVLLEAQATGLSCFASYGVSREVDIGLNLVHYIDLNEGEKIWAEYILNNYISNPIDKNVIYDKFDQLGYSIKLSVKKIEKIYSGE